MVVALVGLALGWVACAGRQTPRDQIKDPGELIYNGFAVSDVTCYKCHNDNGKGTWRGADLAELVPQMTDPAIVRAINEGPGVMPSYKGKLDDQQMAALTSWLRRRFP
jgi:mono/diheme cytochrome c family protein